MFARIVVVNYNSEATLRRCLESIIAQTYRDFEVVVVDNGGNSSAFADAIPADSRIRCFCPGDNTGFAAGNNAGARGMTAPWLATVNPDAFVEPDWLSALVEATQRHPDVSMFGSTQRDAADPGRLDGAGDVYSVLGIPWRGLHGRPLADCPATGEVFSPCAAAALYRSSLFFALGGFDPAFFCYCEDVDLGFRFRLQGERALQVREAVVHHLGSGSSGAGSAFSYYHGFRNRLWTFIKCMPQPLFGALLPLHVVATGVLLLKAAFRGHFRPAMRGLGDALARLGPVLEQRRQLQAGRTIDWRSLAQALTWSPGTILGRGHDVRVPKPEAKLASCLTAGKIARNVWRMLPIAARHRVFNTISGWILPRAAREPGRSPGAVVVVGLFRTASGIGESARLCYHALKHSGMPVTACDLSGTFDQIEFDPGIPLVETIEASDALVIVHVNAPEVQRALWAIGRRTHPDWTVVGYWAWELPVFPLGWNQAFAFLDEVWTPSTFCADHLQHADAPVIRVVPHPVAVAPPHSPTAGQTRARFGLPEHAFIVLTFADARSSLARKNPAAAIEAFLRAFSDRPDTLLVIKTRNLGAFESGLGDLAHYRAGYANLHFLDATLSHADVVDLTACCDAILSLHRSEGFGLCLAQGMALGKPVVASAWSGNLDFMDDDSALMVPVTLVPVRDPSGIYAQATHWADPDVAAAAAALVALEQDRSFARARGQAGQRLVQTRLNTDAYRQAAGLPVFKSHRLLPGS